MKYCPYLGHDTDDEFSLEHIAPRAIGCPDSFSIQVSRTANSQAGDTIDAALVNSFWVEPERHRLKITSHGGSMPKLTMNGIIETATGEQARASFQHDYVKGKTSYKVMENRFEIISLDPGQFKYVGVPSQAEQVIRKTIARENLAISEAQIQEMLSQIPKENFTQQPLHVEQRFHIDDILYPLDRCVVKMALATSVRLFGEDFAKSADGVLLRQFMWEPNSEVRATMPLKRAIFPQLQTPIPNLHESDRHVIALYRDYNKVIFSVCIFGKFPGCLVVSENADSYQWPNEKGMVWVIEPVGRTITEQSYLQHIASQAKE